MKIRTKIHIFLSHHAYLYAIIVGVGVVLFWRGVWHSVDLIHFLISRYELSGNLSLIDQSWWDGPLSFIVGCIVLYLSRAFVSSFIGNELILSGLRTEKKLNQAKDTELITEVAAITDIKDELSAISRRLGDLEVQIKDHHK
jgi:hypothetical protein